MEKKKIIIISLIIHIHSCDIFEYNTSAKQSNRSTTKKSEFEVGKDKIFIYIYCFSKKACMIVVSQNFANIIIEALNYVVNFLGNPKYL